MKKNNIIFKNYCCSFKNYMIMKKMIKKKQTFGILTPPILQRTNKLILWRTRRWQTFLSCHQSFKQTNIVKTRKWQTDIVLTLILQTNKQRDIVLSQIPQKKQKIDKKIVRAQIPQSPTSLSIPLQQKCRNIGACSFSITAENKQIPDTQTNGQTNKKHSEKSRNIGVRRLELHNKWKQMFTE